MDRRIHAMYRAWRGLYSVPALLSFWGEWPEADVP